MIRRASGTATRPSLSRDNAAVATRLVYDAFEQLAGQRLVRDAALDRQTRVCSLAPGGLLFGAGSVDSRVHVVLEGFLTLKYASSAGTSWIKGFVPPLMPFACVSCLDGARAHFDAYAGAATTVASIPFRALDHLSSASAAWQRALLNAFKRYGQRKEKRERELLTLSAEARYVRFLQDMPEIAARLKQHEIANYVRVTPVSLSRIRRRLQLTRAGAATACASDAKR